MKKNLVIINNEKCIKKNGDFYCENIEVKSISQLLSKKFNVKLILRKSSIKPIHKICISNVIACSNIFSFFYNLLGSLKKDNAKYLIISVTPYSFFSFIFLFLFRKKIFLYLRSDGKKEISVIFGKKLSIVYKAIENIMANLSDLIVVNNLISNKKKFNLVNPSQIDDEWFKETKISKDENIKLLYVGRLKIEKGVFSLIDMIKKIQEREKNVFLTLIGQGNRVENTNKNIKFLNPISAKGDLIKQYDKHDILVLPSFTEGHPQVLLESLARNKPVVIFDEIKHVAGMYNGIFICERNHFQLEKTIKYIDKNYKEILPSKKKFFFVRL